MRNRNVILFEDLQDAQVRESARKTPAERDADARTRFPGRARRTIAADWGLRIHESKDAAGRRLGQWEARPEMEVQKYCERNRAEKHAQTRNSTFLLVPYPLCTIVGK